MAHPMQHHGERRKEPTTTGLYRRILVSTYKSESGKPQNRYRYELVDGPVYRIDLDKCRLPEDVPWHKSMNTYLDALLEQGVLVEVGEDSEMREAFRKVVNAVLGDNE